MVNQYSIIFIVLLLSAVIIGLRKRKKTQSRTLSDADITFDNGKEIVAAVVTCRDVICTALADITDTDDNKATVCRNDRSAAKILNCLSRRFRMNPEGDIPSTDIPAVYLTYMIEAADRISETSRRMISNPEFRIPIAEKCEMQTILSMIRGMMPLKETPEEGYITAVDKAGANVEFVKHLIAENSHSMSHADFNDGSQAYSYLMLLYYLCSFLNSFYRLVSSLARQNGI